MIFSEQPVPDEARFESEASQAIDGYVARVTEGEYDEQSARDETGRLHDTLQQIADQRGGTDRDGWYNYHLAFAYFKAMPLRPQLIEPMKDALDDIDLMFVNDDNINQTEWARKFEALYAKIDEFFQRINLG